MSKSIMSKSILLLAVAATLNTEIYAQEKWTVDPTHSNVKFTVTHMMVSDVDGSFKIFSGEINAKDTTFQDAQVTFSVDVASVNTDNENRDNHLKSDDFFNAEKYPKMTFKSTSLKKVSGNKYKLTGDLTIRDVTKPVTFDVAFGGVINNKGKMNAGFMATSTIKRSDFNLKWNKQLEAGGWVVSDEVRITINTELRKAQ